MSHIGKLQLSAVACNLIGCSSFARAQISTASSRLAPTNSGAVFAESPHRDSGPLHRCQAGGTGRPGLRASGSPERITAAAPAALAHRGVKDGCRTYSGHRNLIRIVISHIIGGSAVGETLTAPSSARMGRPHPWRGRVPHPFPSARLRREWKGSPGPYSKH